MQYACINSNGSIELRDDESQSLPANSIALTQQQYDDVTNGVSILVAGNPISIVPNTSTKAVIDQPNIQGFLVAIESAVGGPMAVNGLMQAVPIFYPTVEGGDWAGTQAIVSVAHSTGVITDAVYQAIKTAATNNAIPLNLA